jgi:type VI secretion system secreted protein VgrG
VADSGQRLPIVEYAVEFADGPAATWTIDQVQVDETINGTFRLSIDLATADLDVSTRELLGAGCELRASRGDGPPRWFYGIVFAVDWLGQTDHRLSVRVLVVPAFRLLDQRTHSRIWQDCSVQDIVKEVLDAGLGDYDRTFDPGSTSRGTSPRDYCVQYRESDYAFVCRLLEEEGITWFFNHDPDAGHEVLTFADANDQYQAIENVDGTPVLPLVAHNPDEADVESMTNLEWTQELTSTAALRRDFDWLDPSNPLTFEQSGADDRGRTRRLYAHGQRRYIADDQSERAADLVAAAAMYGTVARGRSNAIELSPGLTFEIDGHDNDEAATRYLVTWVSHAGSGNDLSGAEAMARYENQFECIPADVEVRPRQITRKPRVHGPQTATVVGEGEIDTDEHGRIQVQFHWEESPSFAAGASCRIRVAQSWAGGGWGAQFIPRVGMEVVVEFLEGNPDRPLCTGCVYNGNNGVPFGLPDNATQSGWRTNSSPGGGGSNELRFEDAAGGEEIYLHGQKDWTIAIENDKNQTIGHDETLAVAHDRTKTVDNNQSETIGVDKTISVGANHGETIGANMTVTVGGDHSETISGSRTETISKTATENVALAKTINVGAAMAINVGAAMAVSVGAALATTVGGVAAETVGASKSVGVAGSSSETVGGDKSLAAANINETAKNNKAVKAGKDMSIATGKKFSISAGDDITLAGKKKAVIELADELSIKVGSAMISLKKNGDIVFKGKNITIKASSNIVLKGSKITNN